MQTIILLLKCFQLANPSQGLNKTKKSLQPREQLQEERGKKKISNLIT